MDNPSGYQFLKATGGGGSARSHLSGRRPDEFTRILHSGNIREMPAWYSGVMMEGTRCQRQLLQAFGRNRLGADRAAIRGLGARGIAARAGWQLDDLWQAAVRLASMVQQAPGRVLSGERGR